MEDKTREVLASITSLRKAPLAGVRCSMTSTREVSRKSGSYVRMVKGLDDVVSEVFTGTTLQRCTTHLKRNILSDICNGDKGDLADDRRQVFRT